MRKTVVALAATTAMAICAATADWPQFQGASRDAKVGDGPRLARTWPEGGPKVLWTAKLGPGFGGPAVKGGKVYLLDRPDNAKEILHCWNLASGKEEWTYTYDAPGKKLEYNGSRSTPAVDDKHIFTVGAFGHFQCIDKKTRKPVWSKNLITDFGGKLPHWGVAQSPLLYKDTVIVAPQSRTVGVVAFQRASGKELWRSKPLGQQPYTSPMIVTVDGVDQVVVISETGIKLAGVSAADGAVLWTSRAWKCNIPIPSPTDCGQGRVFFTGGYKAGSVMLKIARDGDAFKATEVFRKRDLGALLHTALIRKGHLYVNCNTKRTNDGLVCMDLDGNIKWQQKSSPNFERGGLLLAGDVIYIMDGKTGELRMVRADPAGYKELGKTKVLSKGPIWAPLVLADGKLLCRDQVVLKCLDVSAVR